MTKSLMSAGSDRVAVCRRSLPIVLTALLAGCAAAQKIGAEADAARAIVEAEFSVDLPKAQAGDINSIIRVCVALSVMGTDNALMNGVPAWKKTYGTAGMSQWCQRAASAGSVLAMRQLAQVSLDKTPYRGSGISEFNDGLAWLAKCKQADGNPAVNLPMNFSALDKFWVPPWAELGAWRHGYKLSYQDTKSLKLDCAYKIDSVLASSRYQKELAESREAPTNWAKIAAIGIGAATVGSISGVSSAAKVQAISGMSADIMTDGKAGGLNQAQANLNKMAAEDKARIAAEQQAKREVTVRQSNPATVASVTTQSTSSSVPSQSKSPSPSLTNPTSTKVGAAQTPKDIEKVAVSSAKQSPSFEFKTIAGSGQADTCMAAKETALKLAHVSTENGGHRDCFALGDGWSFDKVTFAGREQAFACSNGTEFKAAVTDAVISCKKRTQ